MATFRSCFVGIPLPATFQHDFEKLLQEVRQISNDFTTVHPYTPHITLSYLGNVEEEKLSRIQEILLQNKDGIPPQEIHVGGMGYFTEVNPRVLFLKAHGSILHTASHVIDSSLGIFKEKDDRIFYPHLTVSRIKSYKGKRTFLQKQEALKSILDTILWKFTLHEVVLYAIPPKEQHQKRITSMELA